MPPSRDEAVPNPGTAGPGPFSCEESVEPGTVYLIASPIGNLADISLRALGILAAVDRIACEDTRHSRRLLQRYGIEKPLISLHDHNEASRTPELLECLQRGESLALISDAGTPCISDPGYRFHQACLESGLSSVAVPGPSAVLAALVGSGFPSDAFFFGGFLPVKSGKRGKELEAALERSCTSIYFESPHRILKTLAVLAELDASRPVCVARELTKKFETFHRGTAAELVNSFGDRKVKGEITLLLRGRSRRVSSRESRGETDKA